MGNVHGGIYRMSGSGNYPYYDARFDPTNPSDHHREFKEEYPRRKRPTSFLGSLEKVPDSQISLIENERRRSSGLEPLPDRGERSFRGQDGLAQRQDHSYHEEKVETRRRSILTEERMSSRGGDLNNPEKRRKSYLENERGGTGSRSYDGGILKSGSNSSKVDEDDRYDMVRKRYAERIPPNKGMPSKIGGSSGNRRSNPRDDEDFKGAQSQRDQDDQTRLNSLKGVGVSGFDDLSQADKDFAKEWNTPDFFQRLDSLTFHQNQRKRSCWDDIGLSPGCLDGLPCSNWRTERGFFGGISCICNNNRRTWIPPWETPLEPICPHLMESVDRMIDSWREEEELQRRRTYPSNDFNELLVGSEETRPRPKYGRANPDFKRKSKPNLPRTNSAGSLDQNSTPSMRDLSTKGSTKSIQVGPIIPRRKSTDPELRDSKSNHSRDARRSQRSKKLIQKGEGPEMTLSERPKITSFRDTPGEIHGSKYPTEKQWQKSPSKISEPWQERRFLDEDPIPYSKSSSRFPEMPNSISHSSSSSQDTPIPEQDVNVRVPKAYQWPEWHPASTNAPGEPELAQGSSKNPRVSEPEAKLKSYPWPIWHPLSQTRGSQSGAPPDLKSARESPSKLILLDHNGSFKQAESSPDQKKSIQMPPTSGRSLEPFERQPYSPESKSGQFTPSGSAINSENDLITPRSQEYSSIPYSEPSEPYTQVDQAEKSPKSGKVNVPSKRDPSIQALQPKEVLYPSPNSKYGPKSFTGKEENGSPRETLPKRMRSGHFPDLRNLFEEPVNGDSRDTPLQRQSGAPFQSESFIHGQNGQFQGSGGGNALSSREVDSLRSNLKPRDLVSPSFKSKESLEPSSSKKQIPGQRDQSKGFRDQSKLTPDQIKKPSGVPFEPGKQSGISSRRSKSSKFIPKQEDPVLRTSPSQDPIPEGYSGPFQEDQIESPLKGSSEQGSSPSKSPPSLETPPEFKWRSVRPVPEHFHPDPESLYKPKAHSEDSRREFEPFNLDRGYEGSPKSEHTSQKSIEGHIEPDINQGTQLTNIPPSRGISTEERLKLFPGRVPTQDQMPSEPSFQKRGSLGSEYLSKSSLRLERSSQMPPKSNYGPQMPSSLESLPEIPSSQQTLQGERLKSPFLEEKNQFQEDTTGGKQDIEQKRKRIPSASKFQSEEHPKTSILRPDELSASPLGEKSRDIQISGMPHTPNSPTESRKQFQGSEIGGRRGFDIPLNQMNLPAPSQKEVSSKNLPESRVWSESLPNQEEQIGYTPTTRQNLPKENQSRTSPENKPHFEAPQRRSLNSFEPSLPKEQSSAQSWPENSLKSFPIQEDQLVQREHIPEGIKSRSEISKSSLRSRNLHQFNPKEGERQPQKTHSGPVNQEELSWLFPDQRSQAEPIKINPLGSKEPSQIPRPIKDERVLQHRMVQPEPMPGETSRIGGSSIGENSDLISHPSREPIQSEERPKTSFEPGKQSTKHQMQDEDTLGHPQREWSKPSLNQRSPLSNTPPDRRISKEDRLRLFPEKVRQLEEPIHGENLRESPFKKEQHLRGFSGSKSNLRPERSSQMPPKYGPQTPSNMQMSSRIPSDQQTYQEQPLESLFPNERDQSRGSRTERKQSPQHMSTISPFQSEERRQISFRSKEIQPSPNQNPPRGEHSQPREYPETSSNQNNFVKPSGTQRSSGQNKIPPSQKGLPSPQFQSPGQFRFSSRSREDLEPSQSQKEPGKTFSGREGHTESSRRSGSSKIPIRSRPEKEGPIEKSISPHLNLNQSEIKRSGLSQRNQHQFEALGTQSGISTKNPPSSFQTREQPGAFTTYSGLGQRDNLQSNKLEKKPRFPSQNVPHSPNIQPKDSRTPAKLEESSKEPSHPSARKWNQSGYSPEGVQRRSEPSPSFRNSSLPRPTQDYKRSEHSGHPQPIQMHQESHGGPLSRQMNQAQAPPRSNPPSGDDFQPKDQLRSHNLTPGSSELPKNSKAQGLIPRESHLLHQRSHPRTFPGQVNAPPKHINLLEPTPQTSKNGKDLTKTQNPKSKPDGQTRMKFGSISRSSYTPTFDDHPGGCLSPISLSNPSYQTSSSCFSPPRCEIPSSNSDTLPKCPDSQ